MDSTIIAAIISAAASVIVALIGNIAAHSSPKGRQQLSGPLVIPKRNQKIWLICVCLFLIWLTYAALFLHWDLAGMSGLAIPVIIWILSIAFPIRPSIAAAAALSLFPLAFAAEPIGKWRRGMSFENHFEANVVATYIGIAFVTAFIAWLLTKWRERSFRSATEDINTAPLTGKLAKEIADLAELHRTGVLSDEEFSRAKDKLLSK